MKKNIVKTLVAAGIAVATLEISESCQTVTIVRNWGAPKMMDICNAIGNAGFDGSVKSTSVLNVTHRSAAK